MKNPVLKATAVRLVLGWRALSPSRRLLGSRTALLFLGSENNVARALLAGMERIALLMGAHGRPILSRLGAVYQHKGAFQKAFEIYFLLFRRTGELPFCQRAVVCERLSGEDKLFLYFQRERHTMPGACRCLLECEYSKDHEDIVPDWDGVLECISRDVEDLTLVHSSVYAAIGFMESGFIDRLLEILFEKRINAQDDQARRALTAIAAAYYRMGCLESLRALTSRFDYSTNDWSLYRSFAAGNAGEALIYRAYGLRDGFLRFFPAGGESGTQVALVPEKDLCGEAFNSMFYPLLARDYPGIAIPCDARLFDILRTNFPDIHFIPKTPRYKRRDHPERFDKLAFSLSDYLDNQAFEQLRTARFVTIDYLTYLAEDECRRSRETGWLRFDSRVQARWREELGGKTLIGISTHSTLRSRIRDVHMVDVQYWEDIFSLDACVFVNLNAALSDSDCNALGDRFGVRLVNPGIDLYNDFSNLLAIMSVLDYAILPANNLMDFAAACGLSAIVFSPSNIMRSWVVEDDRYVFSSKIRFVFCAKGESKKDMVSRAARIIHADLSGQCV